MTNANEELYVHERYKFGSKEKELEEFRGHADRVREAQQTLAAKHSPGHLNRVFHMKSHACLAGTLKLLDDRPDATRHGMFGANARGAYNVLARFSSGVGFAQHDLAPDVRGLALKIFGVSDSARSRTVDFLMTNSPTPFGTDQEEFVRFMEANVNPGLLGAHLIGFLIEHRQVAFRLMKATLKIVGSLAAEQYWSGHPYLLGPEQAMKFNVRPLADEESAMDPRLREERARLDAHVQAAGDSLESQIRRWFEMRTGFASKADANYLSLELRDRLERGPIKFVFSVQLARDPQLTPIEDGLVEWKESDTPSIPVAHLILDRALQADACGALRFTPGHYVRDHRPLGNMARGRLFTYEASQNGRHAVAEEPEEHAFFNA